MKRNRAYHLCTVSALALIVLALGIASAPASAGTCVTFDTCVNSTLDQSTGAPPGGTVDAASCAALGGYWNASVDNMNLIPQCRSGCCCSSAGAGFSPKSPGFSCGTGSFPVFDSDPAWVAGSCQQTCQAATPPTTNRCAADATASQDCLCGITPISAGEYCCWNNVGAANSGACAAPPPTVPTCPFDLDITAAAYPNGCTCRGTTITSGVCPGTIITPASCGNSIRDSGEECDYRSTATPTTANGCLDNSGNLIASAVCLSGCICYLPPTPTPGGCDNDGICDAGEDPLPPTSCADCTTPVTCDLSSDQQPAPSDFTGVYDASNPAQPVVRLSWSHAISSCSRVGYAIQRSTTNFNDARIRPNVTYARPPNVNDQTFVDLALPKNTTALYYTLAVYYSTGLSTQVVFADLLTPVSVPSSLCPTSNAIYCASAKKGITCTNYQPSTTNCNLPGEVCTINSGGAVECLQQSTECDKCNGQYGNFPDDTVQIADGCKAGNCQVLSCDNAITCYRDLQNTSVELYAQCSQINSCVEYRTAEACSANICDKPGNCAWVPYDSQTTRGACVPQQAAFQKCSDCNSLGASCTAALCTAISNRCYYNDASDDAFQGAISQTGCFDVDDTYCEFFGTQQACEGGQPYSIDVQYDTQGRRIGGSHAITQRSNDATGRGACVWDATQNLCKRDVDLDSPVLPRGGGFDLAQLPPAQWATLLKDFTPGYTSILGVPNQLYGEPFILGFSNASQVLIALCPTIEPAANCYPNSTANIVGNTITKSFLGDPRTDWRLYYTSVDGARNLETVKTFDFKVDARAPVITITSIANVVVQPTQGTLATDIAIDFSVDEMSTCTTSLTNDATHQTVSGQTQIVGQRAQSFSLFYRNLVDGRYTVSITCADDAGNSVTLSQSLTTDTDYRITNPQPRNAFAVFANATIDISIDTANVSSCRWGFRNETYPQMRAYATSNGTTHRASIPQNLIPTSGVYEIKVACDMSGSIVYGDDPADYATFAIDRVAPNVAVCNALTSNITKTGYQCAPLPNVLAQTFSVVLFCADNPGGTPNFGCQQSGISFCVQPASDPGACTPTPGYTTGTLTGVNDTIIRYTARDLGGNILPVQTVTIQTRDLTPPSLISWWVSP